MPSLLTPIIQAVALTSAGVFAGFTLSLSIAAIPTILLPCQPTPTPASEYTLASQWRQQYLIGFYVSRPLCVLSFLTFTYLGYHSSTTPSVLYVLAAVLTSSGVPYALTFLRRTNGALSIRAEKLCGRDKVDPEAIALNYANRDQGSMEREGGDGKGGWGWGTRELVERWKWHNDIRTAILVIGTLVGGVAIGLDRG